MFAYTKSGERLEFPSVMTAVRKGESLVLLDAGGREIEQLKLGSLRSYGRVRLISERSLPVSLRHSPLD